MPAADEDGSYRVGVLGADVSTRLEPLAHQYLSVDGPTLICERIRIDADRYDLVEDFMEILAEGWDVRDPCRVADTGRTPRPARSGSRRPRPPAVSTLLVFRDGGDRVPLGANVTADAFIDLFAQFGIEPTRNDVGARSRALSSITDHGAGVTRSLEGPRLRPTPQAIRRRSPRMSKQRACGRSRRGSRRSGGSLRDRRRFRRLSEPGGGSAPRSAERAASVVVRRTWPTTRCTPASHLPPTTWLVSERAPCRSGAMALAARRPRATETWSRALARMSDALRQAGPCT